MGAFYTSFVGARSKSFSNYFQSKIGDFSFVFDAANNNEHAVKIRNLLSRMFEKAWPQDLDKGSNQEEIILQHLLTWPSFVRFLGLFCKF